MRIIREKKLFLILVSISVLITGCSISDQDKQLTAAGKPIECGIGVFLDEPSIEIQQVFDGERFPNVVVTMKGTVLATLGGNARSDDGSFYVRRSEDGGQSWSEKIKVAKPAFHGGGVTVNEKTGDILLFIEHAHPISPLDIYKSSDDGKTWDKQEYTIHPDINGNIPSMHMNERGITLSYGRYAGRLLRPTRFYKDYGDRSKWVYDYTNAIYSDDGGYNWHTSEPFPAFGTGEAALEELSDGTIYYNSRRHVSTDGKNPRMRYIAYSYDGGHSWQDLSVSEVLPDGPQDTDYGLMAGLVRLPIKGRDILLFSNVESESGRRNGTIWASFDGGKSWPIKRLVTEEGFAYSSLAAGRPATNSEGWVYLLYEDGGHPHAKGYIARFNLSWVLEG